MKKAHDSHKSNSSSAAHIGKLKLQQVQLSKQRTIRLWISCVVILFLGLHQLTLLHSSPNTHLDSASSDLLYGGFSSKEELLSALDSSNDNTYPKDLLRHLDISTTDIQKGFIQKTWQLQPETNQSGPLVIWSRLANYQPPFLSQNTLLQPKFAIAGNQSIYYGSPLENSLSRSLSHSTALTGKNSTGKEFYILASTGNIVTSWDTAQNSTFCYKTPDRSLSYLNCPNSNDFSSHISVTNKTYNTSAQYIKAKTGDRLEYTLTTQNHGNEVIHFQPTIPVDDILEYTSLEAYPGGTFNRKSSTISWPQQTLSPQQKLSLNFTVRVSETIPSRHQNNNNARSYDCRLTTYYGDLHSVDIVCPPQKVIERLLVSPNNSAIVLYSAWFILITNSLLLLRLSISLRNNKEHINHLRRGLSL